jgi:hypothetical protein
VLFGLERLNEKQRSRSRSSLRKRRCLEQQYIEAEPQIDPNMKHLVTLLLCLYFFFPFQFISRCGETSKGSGLFDCVFSIVWLCFCFFEEQYHMPRAPRADEAGGLYHALNRGNLRVDIFRKEEDFAAFERILHEGLEIHQVELYSYQLMSNHYHLVLRPLIDGEMSRFMGWIGGTHTMR